MSLRAPLFTIIPEQTIQIARAAFPKGNPSMSMRDVMGPIYTNPDFAHLFPKDGQPAEALATLALATVMQFAEGLSDEQAATAVRGRIDWKYALALDLTDPGFDSSVLSKFRTRLIAGKAEVNPLPRGGLPQGPRSPTDRFHVRRITRCWYPYHR